MSLHNRFRILFFTVVSASVLGSVVLAFKLWGVGISDAMEISLTLRAQEYLQYKEKNPEYVVNGEYIKIFDHWSQVPQALKQSFPLPEQRNNQLLSHGFSMLEEPSEETVVTFLLPYVATGTDRPVYVFSAFKPHPQFTGKDHEVADWIQLVGLINLVLILFLGYRLESRLLKPITALKLMADKLRKHQPIEKLPGIFRDDEIGSVAQPLKQAIDEIHNYHLREKQFLESASHELRTSIAVTRSALEIVELRNANGSTDIARPLAQIQRANKNMTALTETLLNLAREPRNGGIKQKLNLAELVEELVQDHRYLLENNNPLTIQKSERDDVSVEPTLCRILLANLIRNAFEHAAAGKINIDINNHEVRVTNFNTCVAASREGQGKRSASDYGYGLGLAIVQKIATKEQWDFIVSENSDEKFQVIIRFS